MKKISTNNEKNTIKLSVRALVEFMFRAGDIVSTGSGIKNTEAMQLGSRIHRKIQGRMGAGYEPEVPLSAVWAVKWRTADFHSAARPDRPDSTDSLDGENGFDLVIEGRADGIFTYNGTVTVDEIKGVYADVLSLSEPAAVHRAQAMCYAYMIAEKRNLDSVGIQLTYCSLESELIRKFNETFTRSEIAAWYGELMKAYEKWAVCEYDWKQKRNASIRGLVFPFPYRKGQKNLAAMVYRTIMDKKRLFIEAPTGVGKTISTLFPAILSMGEGLCGRIFYLTAKTVTRTVAEESISLLCRQDLFFRPITITAKEKMCVLDRISCTPDNCPRARGHFDRINDALYDMITHENKLTRGIVGSYAEKHCVCPFEMQLDASLFADAVICDYNYVFDPNVYLRRFFSAEKKGDMVLLIDEAHNLVERGREMFSAALAREDFLKIRRMLKEMESGGALQSDLMPKERRTEARQSIRNFIQTLGAANRHMLSWKKDCEEFRILEDLGTFPFELLRLLAAYEAFAKNASAVLQRQTSPEQPLLEFIFAVRNFCMVSEWLDDSYQLYTDYDAAGNFRVRLQCMVPAERLRETMDKCRSSILFSATLLPIRYYREQLSGDMSDTAVYAESSFLPEQRKILVASDVTSRYSRRGADEYKKIARYIEMFVLAKEGNYLVFFPSYAFLENVAALVTLPENYDILIQNPGMTEKEKEDFLGAFAAPKNAVSPGHFTVGYCVMGGIFSEGIDLSGDRLIGAAVVGTGLPMVCRERDLFRDYFDKKNGKGFDYAYLYPGVNKVLQAGGRVIRTAEDKGAILLLDERFLERQYTDLFPREWFPFDVVNTNTLGQSLAEFWEG